GRKYLIASCRLAFPPALSRTCVWPVHSHVAPPGRHRASPFEAAWRPFGGSFLPVVLYQAQVAQLLGLDPVETCQAVTEGTDDAGGVADHVHFRPGGALAGADELAHILNGRVTQRAQEAERTTRRNQVDVADVLLL